MASNSYASSLETTNYARICRIVVDVFRDILFQVLIHEIQAADLPKKVQSNINKLGKLDLKIKSWMCGISPSSTEIPSAEKFDVSSLYTLVRNLCSQVPAPSTKWGQIPPASGITLGDDIERVREFRNTLYGHATQAKIETPDFNKLCMDIKNVVNRFDAHFHSFGNPMKCDFGFEIDSILTCSMDSILEDDYIDKMKQIALLSDDFGDVKHQVIELQKKVDVLIDFQKALNESAEDKKNYSRISQENWKKPSLEKCQYDKREDMNDSLVDEQESEGAEGMKEDIALEMPPGQELDICIIKCYVDLKLELEKTIVIRIAKDLFEKKKNKDAIEEISKADSRRLCVDQLLKRVLLLEEHDLKRFFVLLAEHCPEIAQKLVEIGVTDKDRSDFTQISKRAKKAPHRKESHFKFDEEDVEFFQCQLQNTPEKIDAIADALLSRFHISIYDHSEIINYIDQVTKPAVLLEEIKSCHFDSVSEVQSVLESDLYKKWQNYKADDSRQGLENQSIWNSLLERMQSFTEYLIRHFAGLRIRLRRAYRGSLVLKFETLDDFDVKFLKPEAVKTKILDMIKTVCPEYQDIFKEPIHLAIFFKPSINTDSAEVYFYLETSEEKEVCSCMKLGSHDIQYIVEEINSASLTKWMFNKLQLKEDTKTKLVDLISSKGMPRREKMRKLLSIVESLDNGYELLEKYCEEHDTFVYDKVFKKRRQMMIDEKRDGSQQTDFSHEKEVGLQRLSCTWIDFTVDPKENVKREDMNDDLVVEEQDSKEEKTIKEDVALGGFCLDDFADVKHEVGDLKKKLDIVHDDFIDFQKAVNQIAEGTMNNLRISQEKQPSMESQQYGDFQTKELAVMTDASKEPISSYKKSSHSSEEHDSEDIEKKKDGGGGGGGGAHFDFVPHFHFPHFVRGGAHFDFVPHFVLLGGVLGVGVGDNSLPPIVLDNKPTERQLGRITMKIRHNSDLLANAMGLSETDIQQIQKACPDSATQSLMICFKWMMQSGDKATFRNLEMAFKHADINVDMLSANKAVYGESCLPHDMLYMQPDDKHLNRISSKIETEHVHLGVELEVPLSRIEQILADNLGDVHKQCFEIMKEWKQKEKWHTTFRALEKAFICIGINPDILKDSLK